MRIFVKIMAKDTVINGNFTLQSKGKTLNLTDPVVMAILNLTPDSFYKESRTSDVEKALSKCKDFIQEGASIIDLGAYSSRPGAAHISEQEELDRLLPILESLSKEFPETWFSVDTFRSNVAEAAINAGAHIINDIAAGNLDEKMFETVARLKVPYVMMHMKGNPQNMQKKTQYEHLISDIIDYFKQKIETLTKLGAAQIVIDPGFGFAKTIDQNFELLARLEKLKEFNSPILVGLSRKSMINKTLNISAQEALNGTTVLNTIALSKGARILRVHDVKAAHECITLWKKTCATALFSED